MDRKYIAFISYRHKPLDMLVAKRLQEQLERFSIPHELRREGKKLGYVFRDQDELPVSSDLSSDIRQALDHSEYLIVICSQETPASPWVTREIDYFMKNHDRSKILTVLVDGTPATSFPEILTGSNQADVQSIEPLAANIVSNNKNTTLKKLKKEALRLIAALLNCSYDALIQREKVYRQRRLMAILAVLLLIGTAFFTVVFNQNQQLSTMNEALRVQRNNAQLSESKLLTIEAKRLFEQEDYHAALRYALDALPASAEDDRPYYAPAEALLHTAVGSFKTSSNDYVMFRWDIDRNADIQDYLLAADGKVLALTDTLGMVEGYSVASRELIWQYKTESIGNLHALKNDGHFALIESSRITALSWTDGSIIWQHAVHDGISYDTPIYFSRNNDTIAYITNKFNSLDLSDYLFELTVLSADDGQVLLQKDLARVDDPWSETCAYSFGNNDIIASNACAFSPDGSMLYGAYYATAYQLKYYRVNIETGDIEIIFSEELPIPEDGNKYRLKNIHVSQNGMLYSIRSSANNRTAAVVERINPITGKLIWSAEIGQGEHTYYSIYDHIGVFHDEEKHMLYIGVKNEFYGLSSITGKTKLYTKLNNDLVYLYPIDRGMLGYVTNDGNIGILWPTGDDIYVLPGPKALTSEHPVNVQTWNKGYLKVTYRSPYKPLKIAHTQDADHGYMTYIPNDNRRRLCIVKPVSLPLEQWKQEFLFPERIRDVEVDIRPGHIAIQTSSPEYITTIIDMATKDILQKTKTESYFDLDLLFSDGTGYLIHEYDKVVAHEFDGETTVLAEEKNELAFTKQVDGTNINYMGSAYTAGSVRSAADGSLITACCNGKTLSIWQNAKQRKDILLPDGMCFVSKADYPYEKMLHIGRNGLVILSRYDTEKDVNMSGFLVYDITEHKWYQITDIGKGTSKRPLAICNKQPIFAVLDADNTIRAYHIRTNSLVGRAVLDIPADLVSTMDLILDGTHAVITTQENDLIIADLLTGRTVFHTAIPFTILTSDRKMHAVMDEANHRLYLYWSDTTSRGAFCIDINTWEQLATFEGAIYFDAENSRLYILAYSFSSGYKLLSRRIPSMPELVDTLNDILQ